jgi:hypothetical protein
VYFPGGVADPAHNEGYLRLYRAGVHAVSLAAGEILWGLDRAAQPILVLADFLVALAEPEDDAPDELRVLVLDRSGKGGVVREIGPILFPAWVRVGAVPRQNFHYRVEGAGDNTLLLHWHAQGDYRGGANPTPEIQRQANQYAAGTARVPLRGGKAELLPAGGADEDGAIPPSADALLPSEPYRREGTGSAWSDRAWRVEGLPLLAFLRTEADAVSGERRVLLKTRQTGKRLNSRELVRLSTDESLEAVVTQDGAFVAMSVSGGAAGTSHRRLLFSVVNRKPVADWRDTRPVSTFSVLGDRAFFLTLDGDAHLEARKTPGGELLWSADLHRPDQARVSPRALRQKSAR